jgi:hypothetical protein
LVLARSSTRGRPELRSNTSTVAPWVIDVRYREDKSKKSATLEGR